MRKRIKDTNILNINKMAKLKAGTFNPGVSGNPSGQKTGRTRTVEGIRERIRSFISINLKTVQHNFDCLKPEKKLLFLTTLMKFVVPSPDMDLSKLSERDLDILIERLKEKHLTNSEGEIKVKKLSIN